MAAATFQLAVLTAEGPLWRGEVQQVTVPTDDGEITLLPHHLALVSNLHAGELAIQTAAGTAEQLFVAGGVLEFSPQNTCRVLADVAERVDEIDEKQAEEARQRATATLAAAQTEPEVAAAQAALFEALMRLRVAEKNRKLRR